MLLDLGFVHDDLHEWHLSDERVLLVLDVLGCGQQHVELEQLVPGGHPALDGHVHVVDCPVPQVGHSHVLVTIVVDQGPQLCPFVEEILPVVQLRLGGDDKEGPGQLELVLQVIQVVDQGDALPEAVLVRQDAILVARKGLLETAQAALLELEELEVLALEERVLGPLAHALRHALRLLVGAALGTCLAERDDELIQQGLLLLEELPVGVVLLAADLALHLQHQLEILDHLRVDQPAPHADLALLAEKLLDLPQVLALQHAQRLPCDLRVGQALPLDQEERLERQAVELLQLVGVPWALKVAPVEVVLLEVERRPGILSFLPLLLEQVLQQALHIVLEQVGVGEYLALHLPLEEQPREIMAAG